MDTNYSNWLDLLSDRWGYSNYKYQNQRDIIVPFEFETALEEVFYIVNQYFTERSINDLRIDEKLKEIIVKTDVKKLSYAHLDVIEGFYETTNELKSAKIQTMFNAIKRTTDIGDKAEKIFLEYLGDAKAYVTVVANFSKPGNLVDTDLGIDLIIKVDNKFYAVQVKSNQKLAEYAVIKKWGKIGRAHV